MMDEALQALEILFRQELASEGKYYTFTDIEMAPKSKAQPFPLYVGGHNLAMIERAGVTGRVGCRAGAR